jgi:hypothetical protein
MICVPETLQILGFGQIPVGLVSFCSGLYFQLKMTSIISCTDCTWCKRGLAIFFRVVMQCISLFVGAALGFF